MGVAKVKRVQCHPPPHPSKPSGNLFFIEFNVCDDGRPEIHFQRWVSVIVDPNQQVIDQYTAEKEKKNSFHFYFFRISLKDASFKINKKITIVSPNCIHPYLLTHDKKLVSVT